MQQFFKIILNSLILMVLIGIRSSWANDVATILAEKQPPNGVVFEIVSGESGLLTTLLPIIKTDIKKLRMRFPQLPIAIVTHGSEQFDLTLNNQKKYKQSHDIVKNLVTTANVDIHVCGTHAGWYDVMPEDFPDYVDVTHAGPTQINHYEELGYTLIVLP